MFQSKELSLPKHLIIETTRRCNLRCLHCKSIKENNAGNYEAIDIPLELFRKLLPTLRQIRPSVQLSGHGETLVHPNFMEMLEDLCNAGCQVSFQTNGMLLTPQIIDKIVQLGVTGVGFSLDAANPELFAKIRRGSQLDKIVENILLINKTKKLLNKNMPSLSAIFVAMRQNIRELPAAIDLAAEIEISKFTVVELKEYAMTVGQSMTQDSSMAEWADIAEERAKKWGIELRLPTNILGRNIVKSDANKKIVDPEKSDTYKGLRKTCKEPWDSLLIRPNGEVIPCCAILEAYGNLSLQSFEECWTGPKYQNLRKAILTDKPFKECVNCSLYGWEAIPSSSRWSKFRDIVNKILK